VETFTSSSESRRLCRAANPTCYVRRIVCAIRCSAQLVDPPPRQLERAARRPRLWSWTLPRTYPLTLRASSTLVARRQLVRPDTAAPVHHCDLYGCSIVTSALSVGSAMRHISFLRDLRPCTLPSLPKSTQWPRWVWCSRDAAAEKLTCNCKYLEFAFLS